MKKRFFKFLLIILFIFVLFVLSGCNNQNEEAEIKLKVIAEVEYLDNKIINIMNSVNNISYINNINAENTNWNLIQMQIEDIYNSWTTILVDLYEIGIDKTDIFDFSSILDNSSIYIKEQNKNDSLIELAKLYSYITKYSEAIYENDINRNIKALKLHILNAYANVRI